jgi:hypothetical protein
MIKIFTEELHKKGLAVKISDMDYTELEIAEGGVALSAFAYMAMGLYDQDKSNKPKKIFWNICKLDTLALVKMHKFLADVADNKKNIENLTRILNNISFFKL